VGPVGALPVATTSHPTAPPAYWLLSAFSPQAKGQLLAIPERSPVVVTGALGMNTWEKNNGSSETQIRVAVRSIERLMLTRASAQRESGDDGDGRRFAAPRRQRRHVGSRK
jgi:hypothetical protein